MRIYYSDNGSDPMLIDCVNAIKQLANDLHKISSGQIDNLSISAVTEGDPAPHQELLRGIRLKLTQAGYPTLVLNEDRWLELSAQESDLERLCRNITCLKDGEHTHLYSSPISLIIEADDSC